MNLQKIYNKTNDFITKHIQIISLLLVYSLLLKNLYKQEYVASYILLILTLIAYSIFKKWNYLIYCLVFYIPSYLIIDYYHIVQYKSHIQQFVLGNFKTTNAYNSDSNHIDEPSSFNRYNIVLKKLEQIHYSPNDIQINYLESIKDNLLFSVQIKNICFSVTIDWSEGKDPFPPILFLGEFSCVSEKNLQKKIN